jgi:hypothetical protein
MPVRASPLFARLTGRRLPLIRDRYGFFTGNPPFNAIEEFKGEYSLPSPADLRYAPTASRRVRSKSTAVGILCRRPARLMDHLGIDKFGDGLLHWRPLHLESSEARTESDCRAVVAQPWAGVRRCATGSTRRILGELGCTVDRETAGDLAADDRPVRDRMFETNPTSCSP